MRCCEYSQSSETFSTPQAKQLKNKCTLQKAINIAFAVLCLSAVSIATTAILINYPAVSSTLITALSISTTLSFVTLVLLLIKSCRHPEGHSQSINTNPFESS